MNRREAVQLLGEAAATKVFAADAPDVCFLSAGETAALIRRKKLSAREVLAAHLKKIERVNPRVNARPCGGSRGAAAVRVACGLVPSADGSDSGGSLRNSPHSATWLVPGRGQAAWLPLLKETRGRRLSWRIPG